MISPNFKISKEQAENSIRFAYEKWKAYVKRKHWDQDMSKLVENSSYFYSMEADARDIFFPALEYKIIPECSGQEDLKIYFGVEDRDVKKAKGAYEKPIAFAERKLSLSQGFWSKGFIYITNIEGATWSEDRIRAILMHEIGHTLGCTHVSDTIMDENFEHALLLSEQDDYWKNPRLLKQIDWSHELYLCKDCDIKIQGYPAQNGISGFLFPNEQDSFSTNVEQKGNNGTLTFQAVGSNRTYSFAFRLNPITQNLLLGSTEIFKVAIDNRTEKQKQARSNKEIDYLAATSNLLTTNGTITINGLEAPMIVNRNIAKYDANGISVASPYEIKVLINSEYRVLFDGMMVIEE